MDSAEEVVRSSFLRWPQRSEGPWLSTQENSIPMHLHRRIQLHKANQTLPVMNQDDLISENSDRDGSDSDNGDEFDDKKASTIGCYP